MKWRNRMPWYYTAPDGGAGTGGSGTGGDGGNGGGSGDGSAGTGTGDQGGQGAAGGSGGTGGGQAGQGTGGSGTGGGQADGQAGGQGSAGNGGSGSGDQGGQAGGQGAAGDPVEWPEAARNEIGRVRNEAAEWRVKFRDSQAAVTAANTRVQELETRLSGIEDTQRQAQDAEIANWPDDLKGLITGETDVTKRADLITKMRATVEKALGAAARPGNGQDPKKAGDSENKVAPPVSVRRLW